MSPGKQRDGAGPKGLIRPFKGLIRLCEGLIRPFKGLIRPLRGLIRPFKRRIRPLKGLIRPLTSLLAPLQGLIRPLKGLMRPLKGLKRPFKGLVRPFKGLIRPFQVLKGKQGQEASEGSPSLFLGSLKARPPSSWAEIARWALKGMTLQGKTHRDHAHYLHGHRPCSLLVRPKL